MPYDTFACFAGLIKETMNPFSDVQPNLLFNLGSGKAASQETTNFLLHVFDYGNNARDRFVDECAKYPAHFMKSITRTAIKTFASEGKKFRLKQLYGKVKEIKQETNLMGRLLCLSLQQKIDMQLVLNHTLTPVPLSLCHIDDTMITTKKAVLSEILEKKVQTSTAAAVDCTTVDGMFFLHMLGELPVTFGGVARQVLTKICRYSSPTVHVVFDQEITPSIKDHEREKRFKPGCSENYSITGGDMRRPANFIKALRSNSFKNGLVKFMIQAWQSNDKAHIIGSKTLFVGYSNICLMYSAQEGKVVCQE